MRSRSGPVASTSSWACRNSDRRRMSSSSRHWLSLRKNRPPVTAVAVSPGGASPSSTVVSTSRSNSDNACPYASSKRPAEEEDDEEVPPPPPGWRVHFCNFRDVLLHLSISESWSVAPGVSADVEVLTKGADRGSTSSCIAASNCRTLRCTSASPSPLAASSPMLSVKRTTV